MGNLLPKLIQVETPTKESSNKNMEQLKHLAHEFLGITGRQFEALYSCIAEEMKDAREQDLTRALHSMQEKMDQNSKEAATTFSSILKRVEKEILLIKDLAAKRSNISSEETQQIEAVKDDIRKLKEGEHALNHQMKLREMAEFEIQIARNSVENTASAQKKLGDTQTALNSQKGKLEDFKEELESLKNVATDREKVVKSELRTVKEELESLKNVAKDREKAVTSELRTVKEELKVVQEKTRSAEDEQRELTEAGFRKGETDANLTTESNDKEGSAQTDHLQNVWMDEMAKLINCNKKKRNRDSRYPTLEQNKKLRKRSTRDDEHEHGIASVSREVVYPSSASSSESDSSASALPPKPNLNTVTGFEPSSDSGSSESDSSASPRLPSKSNLNRSVAFGSDSSEESDS